MKAVLVVELARETGLEGVDLIDHRLELTPVVHPGLAVRFACGIWHTLQEFGNLNGTVVFVEASGVGTPVGRTHRHVNVTL